MFCVNCKAQVGDRGRVFESIMLCPTCYTIATRAFARVEKQLQDLLTMAKEAIRLAAIEGKLQPPQATSHPQEVTKKQLLEKMLELQRNHETQNERPLR